MIEVTVKTLDGKNRSFCVPDDITVSQFKEKIANSIDITAETQRLIYQGRVLQDDKKLDEYDVNGKVIHVVARPPPSARAPGAANNDVPPSTSRGGDPSSYVLGSFSLPTDVMDPNQVQNVVQQVITSMGDLGRNARVSTRSSADGSSVDVHINLGQIAVPQLQSESQNRINTARRMLTLANRTLDRLENNGTDDSPSDPPSAEEAMDTQPTPSTSTTTPSTSTATPGGSTEQPKATPGGSTEQSDATPGGSTSETLEGAVGGAPATETPSGTNSTTSTSSSTTTTETSSSSTSATNTESNRNGNGNGSRTPPNRGPNHPAPSALSELLAEVLTLNQRLQPHMDRYQALMGDDPTFDGDQARRSAQRLCNLTSEAMHYVSHAYHNISDLMIDMTRPPPRQLRAPPLVTQQAVIQQTIPVQAHINVASNLPGSPHTHRRTGSGSARTSGASSTSAASTTSSTATSTSTTSPPRTSTASASTSTTAAQSTTGAQAGPAFSIPGFPGAPPVTGTNPYVFMEVGPTAFTINSISAHVVTAPNSTTSNSTSTSTAAGSTGTTTTPSAASAGAPGAPTPPAPGGPMPAGPIPGLFPGLNIPLGGLNLPPGGINLPPGGINLPPGGINIAGGPPGAMPPGAFMPPPEVMQNIIQIVSQAGHPGANPNQGPQAPGRPANGTSAASSSSSSTSSSTSTSTTSTSASASASTSTTGSTTTPPGGIPGMGVPPGGLPRGATFVIPGGMGAGPMGGMLPPGLGGFGGMMSTPPIDPYLHCQSRHLITHRAISAAQEGNAERPENALAGMVSNIVGSLVNQGGMPPASGAATSSAASSSTATTSTTAPPGSQRPMMPGAATFTTTAAGRPRTALPPRGPFGPFMGQLPQGTQVFAMRAGQPPRQVAGPRVAGTPIGLEAFTNMLRQQYPGVPRAPTQQAGASSTSSARSTSSSRSSTSTSTSTTSTSTTSTSQNRPEIPDEVFGQLVGGISQYLAQAALGQRPTDTIADFLDTLGQNYNIPEGQGLLTDIFNCVAQSLTFTDFMAVFYGQSEPLNRTRPQLQQLVVTSMLQGNEYNEANVNAAVERMLDEMQDEINTTCTDFKGRDDINLKETLKQFIRKKLREAIHMIMSAQDGDNQFGHRLYTDTRRMIHEFIALCNHCLEGGQVALERLVEAKVRSISTDVNPMIQQWMVNISGQELRRVIPTVSVPAADLQQYIVRGRSGPRSQLTQASGESLNSAPPGGATAQEVRPCNQNGVEAMETEDDAEFSSSRPNLSAAVLSSLPPPPRPDTRDELRPPQDAQDWQQIMPQDWVPVILRDASRQSRQSPQAPLSDAYINGMPAKRRKLMSTRRPEEQLGNVQQALPEALKRAAEAAGVQPSTSPDALAEDAASNVTLQRALVSHVNDSIRQRIDKDSDYKPGQFPNTDKFFKDKKK